MTKRLEDLLNLPSAESAVGITPSIEDINKTIEDSKLLASEIDCAVDKIDQSLPGVGGLDSADKELDELAQLATENFNSLMTLGMNVEPRFSGVIFQSATTLLGHAISAKTAKIDKKLKMVDLQLKKAKLDQAASGSASFGDSAIEGKGVIIDRNALLKEILSTSNKE
jgi:hypothetical protein